LYMVVYPNWVSVCLHALYLAAFPVALVVTRTSLRAVISSWLVALASVLAAIVAMLLVALAFTFSGMALRWYSNQAFGATMYASVALFASLLVRHKLHYMASPTHSHLNPALASEHHAYLGSVMLWALLLLLLINGLGTVCVVGFWAGPPLFSRIATHWFLGVSREPRTKVTWGFLAVLGLGYIVPILMWSQILHQFGVVMFSLLGRLGSEIAPDIAIAVVYGPLAPLFFLVPVSCIHMLSSSHRKLLLTLSALIMVAMLAINCCIFPFRPERPQRLQTQHVYRQWDSCDPTNPTRTTDSGLFVDLLDYTGFTLHPELKDAPRYTCDAMLCELPWYFPLDFALKGGKFLPAAPPPEEMRSRVRLDVVGDSVFELAGKTMRNVTFEARGTTHMGIALSAPKNDTLSVVDWSFGRVTREDGEHTISFPNAAKPVYRPECDCYFVFRATGNVEIPWRFWLLYEDRRPDKAESSKAKFAFWGHVLGEETKEIREFVSKMPDWTSNVGGVSLWRSVCV